MKLSQLMEQVRGLSYEKKDISNDNREGFIPVLRAGNIQDSKLNNEDLLFISQQKVKEKQFLKFGDILIAASSGSISIVGKAAMVERDMNATFGAFCKVLRPNDKKVDFGYFKHFFETSYYKRTIKSLAEGANINNLKTEHFDELQIPLPPLEQQKKIAAILDAADNYRQKTKALIAKYDELTQSLFLDMFGDPVKNEKGWEFTEIENIARKDKNSIKAGPFGSSLKKEFYVAEGYKIYGQEQVIKDDLTFGNYYIDENKYKELESCKVQSGDILISLVGTYGKISIVPEKFEAGIINPRLMKLSPNNKIIRSDFLKFLLQSEFVARQLKTQSRGGTMDIINVGIIKKVKIPLPSISLQNQFAERVQAIEEQKAQAQASLEKAEELFASLLQKAFKGEIT